MVKEIIFESHSTSEANERNIAAGHIDSPLSKTGEQQAIEMRKRYVNRMPEIILCSDLKRSYNTALLAFPEIQQIRSPLLREWNYGKMNGAPIDIIEKMKFNHIDVPFAGGEDLKTAVQRILGFLKEQFEHLPFHRVMIIGHRSAYYALEYHYKCRSFESLVSSMWSWQPGWTYS